MSELKVSYHTLPQAPHQVSDAPPSSVAVNRLFTDVLEAILPDCQAVKDIKTPQTLPSYISSKKLHQVSAEAEKRLRTVLQTLQDLQKQNIVAPLSFKQEEEKTESSSVKDRTIQVGTGVLKDVFTIAQQIKTYSQPSDVSEETTKTLELWNYWLRRLEARIQEALQEEAKTVSPPPAEVILSPTPSPSRWDLVREWLKQLVP